MEVKASGRLNNANIPRMVSGPQARTQSAAKVTQPGVDVSSFQGPPGDWTAAAGDIVWAAVKVTELEPGGTRYVNPDAQADWDWLEANKKGRIGYLFGHPSVSATDTVDFFLSELNKMGLHDSDAVALDLEVSDGLGSAKVAAWAGDVQSQLKSRIDRMPLLYTFIDFATEGNCAGLEGYPLWIADPSNPPAQPQVPAPWKSWAIHQYDISGEIDRNAANYDSQPAMFTALGKPVPSPDPPPKEPDLTNLGGIVTAISATRWPAGQMVVAGIGSDGYVWRIMWQNNAWGGWGKVSSTKAKGTLSVIASDDSNGQLFYIETSGNTVEMATTNYGDTWT
jgi:lysozyme